MVRNKLQAIKLFDLFRECHLLNLALSSTSLSAHLPENTDG
jgi:hypothetical protein